MPSGGSGRLNRGQEKGHENHQSTDHTDDSRDDSRDRHAATADPPAAATDLGKRKNAEDDRGNSRQQAEQEGRDPQNQAGDRLAARLRLLAAQAAGVW